MVPVVLTALVPNMVDAVFVPVIATFVIGKHAATTPYQTYRNILHHAEQYYVTYVTPEASFIDSTLIEPSLFLLTLPMMW